MSEADAPAVRQDVTRIAAGECIFSELPRLAVLEVTGPEAVDFLHGQITADIKGLQPGRSAGAAYCTPKGRVIATFAALRFDHGVRLVLPRAVAALVRKRLSMYILRAKVSITDVSDSNRVFGVSPAGQLNRAETLGWLAISPHHELAIVAAADAAQRIAHIERVAARVHEQAWRWLDVSQGYPWIVEQTQEAFTPHMLNLDLIGSVNFQKGCYPGQEIVARTQYLGQVKRRMYRALIEAQVAPLPGDTVYARELGNQASGTIVDAAPSPTAGWEVLAVMQTRAVEAASATLGSLDGPALQFLPLPYPMH